MACCTVACLPSLPVSSSTSCRYLPLSLQAELCTRFAVGSYPSVKLGRPADYAEAGKELPAFGGQKSVQPILDWIGKFTGG